MMEIPLKGGSVNAHQSVTVQLGENLIELQLDYLQSGKWNMNVVREGVTLVVGATLEPNADVIEHYDIGIGKLIFTGADTTLDNLGIENNLVWVGDDG